MKYLVTLLAAASGVSATAAIYLTNGINSYDTCGNYQESVMAYYNEISQSQNGQQPSDTAYMGCGYTHWEGHTVTGKFSSGTTFTVNLDAGAGGYKVGQYAGYGRNSYGTGFNCYRDNGRQVYSNRGGGYNSIYYCKQA